MFALGLVIAGFLAIVAFSVDDATRDAREAALIAHYERVEEFQSRDGVLPCPCCVR
jgi:hypothetical protein